MKHLSTNTKSARFARAKAKARAVRKAMETPPYVEAMANLQSQRGGGSAVPVRLDNFDCSLMPEKKTPTVDGYWWTRPDSGCMWRVVEITIIRGAIYVEEMGEDGQDLLPACPWWQWVGPIAPPPKS
jgi:hypothetical protein